MSPTKLSQKLEIAAGEYRALALSSAWLDTDGDWIAGTSPEAIEACEILLDIADIVDTASYRARVIEGNQQDAAERAVATAPDSRSYLETKEAQARALVGKRVEIPVHYDAWARGARFGVVRSLWWSGGACAGVRVRLDRAARMLRIHRVDMDYVKVLEG